MCVRLSYLKLYFTYNCSTCSGCSFHHREAVSSLQTTCKINSLFTDSPTSPTPPPLIHGLSQHFVLGCTRMYDVAQKQGVVPDWTSESSPRGALTAERCSRLDKWIVNPVLFLIVRKIFRIGLDLMVSVKLSSSVKRVNVTRMRDFSSRAFTYKYRISQTDLLSIQFVWTPFSTSPYVTSWLSQWWTLEMVLPLIK